MKKTTFALLAVLALPGFAAETNLDAPLVQRLTLTTNKVAVKIIGEFRVVTANGLPDHAPGAFPNAHNPNRLAPQNYAFRMPLHPQAAAQRVPAQGAWFGVALNGVPFEPGTAEFWQGRREWVMEAKAGFIDLGLDAHNAHVQPNGSYHYHGLPTGLLAKLNDAANRMTLVGWAADGFPIYTPRGHAQATNATSPLKQLNSSWRVKEGARPADAPPGDFNGKFTADYEFVRGSGDLDECNGRFGVTPEFTNGTYYYVITDEFPQLARSWRGTPDSSFFKRGGPPGAGNRPGQRSGRLMMNPPPLGVPPRPPEGAPH
jgi:hypothetical protein